MKILVINTGSSSIKYELFEMDGKKSIAWGMIEKIGEGQSLIKYQRDNEKAWQEKVEIGDHRQGLLKVVALLTDKENGVIVNTSEIEGVGHRVVHGGEIFKAPTLIDETVIHSIEEMIPLAPLHNPANLQGILVSQEIFPKAKQVAVFDTSFHQTMPDYAYRYAVPKELYEKYGIRKYGFHGTSHLFVSRQAALCLNRPLETLNLITLHLGNGCSVAAVKNGKCVDTSMGLTPLEGLIMGTRSGDLDPAIPFFLSNRLGLSLAHIETLLNKESGLKGICGKNDMRDVLEGVAEGDEDSKLAISMYSYRIRKYIGAYTAVLGSVDAIVFTGGVGENAFRIREESLKGLESMGIVFDNKKNCLRHKEAFQIHSEASKVKLLVIPTNEELEIALEAQKIIG